jgi:hypothetical protein
MISAARQTIRMKHVTTAHRGATTPWARQRLAAAAGIAGPLLLGGTILALTLRQGAFLRSLGWDPLRAPTVDWPSGLALSADGPWMVGAFLGSGALLSLFAAGLRRQLAPSGPRPLGPLLLGVAGLALALLAFKTDPTYLPTPRTLGGAIHDRAYVLLGLTLLPGMLLAAADMGRRESWRPYALPTVVVVALAAPAFVLKGVAFYGFLALILGWFLVIAGRLWRLTRE